MDGAVCERWLIAGAVQGVGYRAWMVDEATRLGLDGWVRNLPDGHVETVVRGDREGLDALRRACESGPPAARVERIEVIGLAPGAIQAGVGFAQGRAHR